MDTALISALSALGGSVIGGLTSGITTWLNQRVQTKAAEVAHNKSLREALYGDFIVAASKTWGDAVMSSEPKVPELIALYAMISRMRAHSSPRVVACADEIMRVTIDTFKSPNKTASRFDELVKSDAGFEPLKNFSEAAREELGISALWPDLATKQ
jgi:hypothetical protein